MTTFLSLDPWTLWAAAVAAMCFFTCTVLMAVVGWIGEPK